MFPLICSLWISQPHHSSWTGANLAKFEGILHFILHTPAKIVASASLLCLYGADQQRDRLGQLLVLLGKNLHSYGEQDHADPRCKWQAKNRGKGRRPESSFNNKGLDEWEGGVENIETICWPSILGGTSIY